MSYRHRAWLGEAQLIHACTVLQASKSRHIFIAMSDKTIPVRVGGATTPAKPRSDASAIDAFVSQRPRAGACRPMPAG